MPRRCTAALSDAFGCEVGREQRRGSKPRESERAGGGCMASPWRREGVGETATAKQEVAGALRARATPRLCLLAEEEEDKGGKGGGLGYIYWSLNGISIILTT